MKKILLGTIMSLTTLALTAQETKTIDTKAYSVSYPENWEYSNYDSDNGNFMVYTKLEGAEDRFSENVNLVIQDIEGMGFDLESFKKLSESQVEAYMESPKIVLSEIAGEDDNKYVNLVFQGSMNGFDLKFVQKLFLKNEQAYVLTFTSEQNAFDKYNEQATAVLDSFTLK